mmetsp:Transcript_41352/g.30407  ORF Transcript_41352/g.30407 Transcript_41352/m.30407 type:complete len:126 (+) Transcript_41352:169-546(+)
MFLAIIIQIDMLIMIYKTPEELYDGEGEAWYYLIGRVFMTLLYSAKCSVNLRSTILMSNYMKNHPKKGKKCLSFIPVLIEFLTFYNNLMLGYLYINEIAVGEIFDAIVFGFIVIDTPELVLRFTS